MAAVMSPQPVTAMRDENRDTRTPSQEREKRNDDFESYKPDLGAEVALLSTKLVNAINYQTTLDDSLQRTRHELERARAEASTLRAQKKELDDMVADGVLLRKAMVDQTIAQLRHDLDAERTAREAAEKAKKDTEGEVENLTSALFEEANTMVASARREADAAERRNSQLKGRLDDTELLLASQQEQLQDLKATMERMERVSEIESFVPRDISAPSTPVNPTMATFDGLQFSPHAATAPDLTPDHPLHFTHLLAPILRHDITAYNEFSELLGVGGRASQHSRNSSNNANTLNASSQTSLGSSGAASSPNLPGAFSFSASASPQPSAFSQPPVPALKDSKFFKRILVEDLEPTLRLDSAPGLNLFSRRTVLSSLLQGTLVVEPFAAQAKFYGPTFACALCGESRKNELYIRKHRFRTSEEDSAQRYPLCDYCLGRIRATGDFVGFLRMVRDGHWRAERLAEQKTAWEESVRLREKMFWARLGGGVIPAFAAIARREPPGTPSTTAVKSARQSLESMPERRGRDVAGAVNDSNREEHLLADHSRRSADFDGHSDNEQGAGVNTGPSQALALQVSLPNPRNDLPPSATSEHASDPATSVDAEPTTPFEDAQSEAHQPASPIAAREPALSSAPPTPPQHDPSTLHPHSRTPSPSKTRGSMSLQPSDFQRTGSRTPSPSKAGGGGASAVLARVRAMEAKAGQAQVKEGRLPGAFE